MTEFKFLVCLKAQKYRYLKYLHHWLLIKEISYNSTLATNVESNKILELLDIQIDSQVHLAHYIIEDSLVYLQEVYKIARNGPLIFTQLGEWTPEQDLPSKVRRDDFGGISINSVVVVSIQYKILQYGIQ